MEYDQPLRTARVLQQLLAQSWLSNGLIRIGTLLPSLAQHFVLATRGQQRVVAEP